MKLSRIALGIFVFAAALCAQVQGRHPAKGNVVHSAFLTHIGIELPRGLEDYFIYTPPNYDPTGRTKYPVLYLLHGFGNNASWWTTTGNMQAFLDELISAGKARPMIVVMPASYGDFEFVRKGYIVWLEEAKVEKNERLFARMLLEEIIPRIESTYQVSTKREDRAIAGFSMGGREAIMTGLGNSKEFAWIGGFSAAFAGHLHYKFSFPQLQNADFRLIWVGYGVSDWKTKTGNEQFIAEMNSRRVDVLAVLTEGKHDASVWRDDFQRFVPLLFQPK